MFLAACGIPSAIAGALYGGGGGIPPATPPPTTGGNGSSAVIHTAPVTVKGQSEMVLTNAQGMTLYYFTPDSATQSACTGGCAQAWAPLFFAGGGGPPPLTFLSGKQRARKDGHGSKVSRKW